MNVLIFLYLLPASNGHTSTVPMIKTRYILLTATVLLLVTSIGDPALSQTVNLKMEYASVLRELTSALQQRQILAPANPENGAIQCEYCRVLHTRAAEAVYPFALRGVIDGDTTYIRAAILAGNWLIRQQQQDGSWKETPEEWTGTTTDQLLSMSRAFLHLEKRLTEAERSQWISSIRKSADYLCRVMSPEFASINYVATTSAALAAAGMIVPHEKYAAKARGLAHRTVAKMDADGFINGEGGREHGIKLGVDLGYDMEMSLWGLGYYAKVFGDTLVDSAVRNSLRNHLYFIYPDGSMDNSWGIRSNKWTTYGGVTSDGCQVLFSLYSTEDPRYVTAAVQNLRYLKKSIRDGLVGYGPHHREIFDTQPCIYPTFTKVKNIAFAFELEREGELSASPVPSEGGPFLKTFPTLDVSLVRTKNFMATVTAYRYKDLAGRSRSKYMYRPSGGAVSLLWVKGHGYLQASSVTEYGRPEPMTFPEAPGARCLTPRIEYRDSTGYFTNLFDFDSRMKSTGDSSAGGRYGIDVEGELRDREWLSGGVGFRMEYRFAGESIEKTVLLIYHDARPKITIIEPIIDNPGMTFTSLDDTTIAFSSGGKHFEFHLENGAAVLSLGTESDDYWTPFPALRARPISLIIQPPADRFRQEVRYRLLVRNPE